MSKVISIQLEWSYLPEKYLEDPILIYFEGGELRIKDGTAVATIDPELFNTEKSIREKLTKKIENRLYAVQIMTHQDFQLNKPYRTDVQEDGKKNHFLDVESTAIVTSFGTVDIIVHDKYGNLLSDK